MNPRKFLPRKITISASINTRSSAPPFLKHPHLVMAPSDFAKADIHKIVEQLTTDEAILLIAGVGFWHTHAIERLGIPAIKARLPIRCSVHLVCSYNAQVSDGPNGIRGNHFFMGTPAKCLPVRVFTQFH